MKKTPLNKLADIISFLDVPFSVLKDMIVLSCNETQYLHLTKVLLFYTKTFKILPSKPIDSHFEFIYIEIPKDSILDDFYE